jgi:hypothetical protein
VAQGVSPEFKWYLLSITPKDYKAVYNRDTCTHMFNCSIIHYNGQALKTTQMFQLMNELRKCGFIYTIVCYSTIKQNEIMLSPGKWMGLRIILWSETCQAQKDKDQMFSHICGS